MMTSYFNLLKYAATGQASPDMTYFDKMRASTLMGGVVQTLTGQPPLSFKSDGKPLISWSMKGNGQQTGTPTPDAPIMPDFCGTIDGIDWTIPLTNAGQTIPVYLGEAPTVRRVKKLVLTGEENIYSFAQSLKETGAYAVGFRFADIGMSDIIFYDETVRLVNYGMPTMLSTHYKMRTDTSNLAYNYIMQDEIGFNTVGSKNTFLILGTEEPSADDFKSYLASEYAAGHPVTIWYVLAEPTTGIVNEPLAKIGDYADELSSEDAAVTIPTAKGQNTLTVDTELQPSEMTITFKG